GRPRPLPRSSLYRIHGTNEPNTIAVGLVGLHPDDERHGRRPGEPAGRPRPLPRSSLYRIHGTNEPNTIAVGLVGLHP
ncbi:hypothetical protein CTI14_69025, partial [Methylobacterium radiotolerans]